MTLANFKKNLKVSAVIIFLIVYGLGFYLAGKNSSLVNVLGTKSPETQSNLDSPLNSPVPAADTQTSTITAAFVKLCANTTSGFELSYPKDWFTTYNTEDQKCTFFAPYSFIIPYDTTSFQIPIKVEVVTPEEWEGTVKYYENPNDFNNVISAQNVQLGRTSAKKIESTSTGQDTNKRNFAKVTYLIFDARGPMVASFQQTDEKEDVEEARKVLEEIVSSVHYF